MRASVLVSVTLAACGATPVRVEPLGFLERVRERVELAQEQTRFEVRHNPVACDCPPFEVRLGLVWQRVEFVAQAESDEPVFAELARLLEAADAGKPIPNLSVMGRIEPEIGRCGQGALYVSLVPMELEPGP
jgi:hypothetical protein